MFELRLVKTATDAAAARRLAREALWLRELGDVRSLEGQLPRLIEQGIDASGREFLVVGIQPGIGETRAFTSEHARFLVRRTLCATRETFAIPVFGPTVGILRAAGALRG